MSRTVIDASDMRFQRRDSQGRFTFTYIEANGNEHVVRIPQETYASKTEAIHADTFRSLAENLSDVSKAVIKDLKRHASLLDAPESSLDRFSTSPVSDPGEGENGAEIESLVV